MSLYEMKYTRSVNEDKKYDNVMDEIVDIRGRILVYIDNAYNCIAIEALRKHIDHYKGREDPRYDGFEEDQKNGLKIVRNSNHEKNYGHVPAANLLEHYKDETDKTKCCTGCNTRKENKEFSNKQRKEPRSIRRCKNCISHDLDLKEEKEQEIRISRRAETRGQGHIHRSIEKLKVVDEMDVEWGDNKLRCGHCHMRKEATEEFFSKRMYKKSGERRICHDCTCNKKRLKIAADQMATCEKCRKCLPKERFSITQWKKKRSFRRCEICTMS